MHFGFIELLWRQIYALASSKVELKNKMADSRSLLLNYNNVEPQKENAKNQNILKATTTWLKVWQK